ncbi:MAG: hypothetical protein C3F13_12755 [Anaerolineales bacterium]|nr:hypothetical protein [Anaerolineae bacterium]PWB51775.1 MAG: hypothetical protein C3F13_12755 [Anaerolineales bacterium]
MAIKVDFKKSKKSLYDPKIKGFHIVEVPSMNFLMLDGVGDPNTTVEYQQSIEALYSISYGIKFALKTEGFDHVVPPLEGLWWMDDMREFTLANKYRWKWTMMIMQPDWVTQENFEKIRLKVNDKSDNPILNKTRFERYSEGSAVQILYIGPYAEEAATIADMHAFIERNGYRPDGKHHEIYLSDARKTPPEKLRTILRQPISKR